VRSLAALAFSLICSPCLAACLARTVTDPSRVQLAGDTVMIVTHASAAFDPRMASKHGLDQATRMAREQRIPLVYLADDDPAQRYFMDECDPDYWVSAIDGEVRFAVKPSHVFVAGGHLELCMSTTVHDVLLAWSRQPRRNLSITYLMDAIYSNGKDVQESDAFHADFTRFMGVVTHGRPGGERWPKLTLLETMGIIGRLSTQIDYLKRVLPHYARTMPPEYRVELRLNDSAAVLLSPGGGRGSPTLTFRFVDSALAPARISVE